MSDPELQRRLPVVALGNDPAHRSLTGSPHASGTAAATGRSRLRHWLVHLLRLAIVASLVLALRASAEQRRVTQQAAATAAPLPSAPPATVRVWFGPEARWGDPSAATDAPLADAPLADAPLADAPLADAPYGEPQPGDVSTAIAPGGALGGMPVVDAQQRPLGWWMQTSPLADSVTGYRGPSNLHIGLDPRGRIVGVQLIASDDTPEHVAAVRADEHFFEQFVGRTAANIAQPVDVVSGATLTSLAMAGAVAHRLGAIPAGSSRFPHAVTLSEARVWFPEAATLQPLDLDSADRSRTAEPSTAEMTQWRVLDPQGAVLGQLIRTGPLCDHVHGYQGPTELLVATSPQRVVSGVAVRHSYDNQPYVSYLDDEPWYWDPFIGKPWQAVSDVDLAAAGVEGVSGATMTSMAAAETLVAAAAEQLQREQAAAASSDRQAALVRWSISDVGTITVVLLGLVIGGTHLRGRRWPRLVWQWVVVAYFGLITGNLLSIALLMGWAVSGVPWWLAPGLTVVLAAALLLPALTKSPYYCAQLCPHGTVQQWLRGTARWQWRPSPWHVQWLVRLPPVILFAAYAVALVGVDANLAVWEPFDAYLWPLGAAGAVVVAVISLLMASASPMAYCRFGCPTGQVLRYVRRHGRSGYWTRGDTAACAAAIAAWGWVWIQ